MKFVNTEKKEYKSDVVKCERTKLGTICKFRADIMTLPVDKKESIPINAYISENFKSEGNEVINLLNKYNKEVNNIFKINTKYIEKEKTPKEVIHVPTILVGEGEGASAMYGTDFDARSLLINAQKYLSMQKINF